MTYSVHPGQVWRRGRKQVQVLSVIEPQSLAPRVKLEHWDRDGRVTFRLLATFVREYERDVRAEEIRESARSVA